MASTDMIRLTINGELHELDVDPATPILWVLREQAGLEAGEVIVVNGLQRVRPGAPVTPQPVQMAAQS